MNERKKIEDRLRKKEAEIASLEEQVKAAKVYIQALQDVLKMLPKAPDVTSSLRPGSTIALARNIILRQQAPIHITALLEALGKQDTRENKSSLTSSLAAYVRRGEIFSRPAPNTFGLIELGHDTQDEGSDEPPEGFGQMPVPSQPPGDDDIPF